MKCYQHILITGASSGIGAAIAKKIYPKTNYLSLLGRNEVALGKVKTEIENFYPNLTGKIILIKADVSDYESLKKSVLNASETAGTVDLLIASAGISQKMKASHWDMMKFREIFEINTLGLANSIYSVLPSMLRKNKGHIVGISSLASYRGLPGHAAYSSSKAAVNTILESLRSELSQSNILVTTIFPGYIATPMNEQHSSKLPFILPPDVAADRILGAIANQKSSYAFPWQMNLLVKLITILPKFLFDRLPFPYKK